MVTVAVPTKIVDFNEYTVAGDLQFPDNMDARITSQRGLLAVRHSKFVRDGPFERLES